MEEHAPLYFCIMKYIVYETINLINNKKYIGVHKTENPDKFDGYYGSGKILKQSIEKYGKKYFHRNVLYSFDKSVDAYEKEEELITEDVINSSDYYNIAPGGNGGDKISYLDEVEKDMIRIKRSTSLQGRRDSDSIKLKKKIASRKRIKDHPHTIPNNKGRKHTGTALDNILEGIRKTHQESKFISNGDMETKIPKNMYMVLEKGWYYGRSKKMKLSAKSRVQTATSRNKIKEAASGMLCYNNGIKNIRIKIGNPIPDGFTRGMLRRNNK